MFPADGMFPATQTAVVRNRTNLVLADPCRYECGVQQREGVVVVPIDTDAVVHYAETGYLHFRFRAAQPSIDGLRLRSKHKQSRARHQRHRVALTSTRLQAWQAAL